MRGYAKTAVVGLLMMGLLAVPNLSTATDGSSSRDGNGRHRLLNAELRSKIEHLRDKIANHREDHHNHGGMPGSLEALQAEVANLKTTLAEMANNEVSLLAQLNDANARLVVLETPRAGGGGSINPVLVELAKYVKVDPGTLNGLKGPHVIFHDANVHVQSGSGTTDEAGALTGLGNLIVGYNELQGGGRDGSHNLVVGPFHTYTSTGGVVFGRSNWVLGQYATVLGGVDNRSRAPGSSILGGNTNSVSFPDTSYPQ
jgi:hypothetical protein